MATQTQEYHTSSQPLKPIWQQPSHPATIKVRSSRTLASDSGAQAFHLTATANQDIPANTLVAKNTSTTLASLKDYSTVQISRNQHIRLNSDLLYCNHSCDPNVRFVTSTLAQESTQHTATSEPPVAGAIEVWSIKDIPAGEELRFFYPSTEWDMAQPFACSCGADRCLGRVAGAKDLPTETLKGYWLSAHIESLLAERDGLN